MTPGHSALIKRLEEYARQYLAVDRQRMRTTMQEAAAALREYRQALRDFNLMRDDGTLPSAPNQAKPEINQ